MRKLVIVVATLLLAVPLLAQEGQVADRAQQQVIRVLALETQQVTQWDELLASRETAVKGFAEEIKGLEEQLRAELAKATPDPATVGALVIEIKGLRVQIEAANQTYVEGFEGLLTEEQTGKLQGVRRAARIEPVLPAFRLLGLLPPPEVVQQR